MKKKSFYFKDFDESEVFSYIKKTNIIKISLNRITFLSFVFFSLMIIFSIKIIYLSTAAEKGFYNQNVKKNILKQRRDIVDRNGSVLATNVNLYDIGVRPKLLNKKEKKNLLIKLKLLFSDLNFNKIEDKLNNNNFFWIGKRLTPKERDQLWLIGNKAFVF